jgi:hypothetical protein
MRYGPQKGGLCTGDSHRATDYFTQMLAMSLLREELHAAHTSASTPLSRPAASVDTLCTKIVYISYPYGALPCTLTNTRFRDGILPPGIQSLSELSSRENEISGRDFRTRA